MRVGLFLGHWAPDAGGAVTYSATLLAALCRSARRSEVIVFYYGDIPGWMQQSLRCVKLEMPQVPGGRAAQVARQAWRWIRRDRRGLAPGPLQVAAAAHRVELIWFCTHHFEEPRLPYVYTTWDLQHRLQPYFPEVTVTGFTFQQREELYGVCCRRAAVNIVPNARAADELCRFYGVHPERVCAVHQPTSEFALNARDPAPHPLPELTSPFLFYPAQFWPHKNHVVVLEALRILREMHDRRFVAVFTGSDKGNLAYVKSYARRLGLLDQVRFMGFASESTLLGLYERAFALVFPSFFGPENQPPLEAFALRCPVVAASAAGIDDQLEDGALLFDPGDEHALVAAILRLADERGLRERLIARGREIAQERSGDAYVARVFELIDALAPIRRCWSSDEPYSAFRRSSE